MINFLRKLRRNEMNRSKYLKYAVSEIFLVVIGILVALGINNLNTKRIKSQELSKYYKSLSDEFDAIANGLQESAIPSNLGLIRDLETSLNLIEQKPPHYADSLLTSLGAFGTSWSMALTTPIFDEFKNNGLLTEINDDEIKNALVQLDLELNSAHGMDDYVGQQYTMSLEPYIMKNINYSSIAIGGSKELLIQGGPKSDLEKLVNSIEFWNMLTLKLETQQSVNLVAVQLHKTLTALSKQLKATK